MLDDIGLFDEQYFAYYEDVDLAWRAQRAGWRCAYTPKAHVRHWHSATGEKRPDFKAYLIGRNKVWSFLKNYSIPAIFFILPLFFAYDGIAAIIQAIQLKSIAPITGRLQGWLTAHHFWKKRTNDSTKLKLTQIMMPWQLNRRMRKKRKHHSSIRHN